MRLRNFAWLAVLALSLAAAGAGPAHAASNVGLVSRTFQYPATPADVVVAATVNPADGVTSIDLVYNYDPSLLLPTAVFKTGYTNGFSLVSSIGVPGRIEIHLSGGGPLSGSGDVAWVVFRTTGAPGQTAALTWVSAVLNGGAIAAQPVNGSVAARAATATVSIPDTAQGMPGSQVLVPISSTPISLADSFDLILTFNPAVLSAASVQATSLTGCLTLVSNNSVPGTLNILLYGICTVSGSGPLVNVTFDVVGPIGSRTPLNLTRGGINEGAISTVLDDGMFSVCSAADGDGDGFGGCAGDCDDANPNVHPGAAELCNGLDDNCDGMVDGFVTACGTGACARAGVCTAGQDSCVPGAPSPEVCDRIDNNCDGTIDGFPTACGVGACARTGLCTAGQDLCAPGAPAPEICDNIDNNCDGTVDDFPTACGLGACARTGQCSAGHDSCAPGPPAPEICDSIDNNCDGTVDNAPPPIGIPTLSVANSAGGTRLDWTAVPGAPLYDVVMGDLDALLAGEGDFTGSMTACLANDLAVRTVTDPAATIHGKGIWYLVRPTNCGGGGSYESGGTTQVGLRDPEIVLSPARCP